VIPHLYNGTDRTFFFAHEGLRLHTPETVTDVGVPSTCLRGLVPSGLQAPMNAFASPTSGDVSCPGSTSLVGTGLAYWSGAYSLPGKLDSSGLRIDHNINDRFKIFARYNDSPSELDARSSAAYGMPSILSHNHSRVDTATAGAINTLSSHLTNDLRFNYTANISSLNYSIDSIGGATPWNLFDTIGFQDKSWLWLGLFINGVESVTAATPENIRQQQINVVDGLNYSLGQHNFKFGVDYRRVATPLKLPSYQSAVVFYDVSELLSDTPATVQVSRYGGPFEPVYSNLSLYARDEWRIKPRLNLSLGVRWELNPAPKDALGKNPYTVDQLADLSTTKLAPEGTDLWKTRYNNFAPRIGVAYRIHDEPGRETVLRAGFGMFYDTGNNQASSGYTGVGRSTSEYYYGSPFPLTAAQYASIPQPSTATPYAAGQYGGVSAYDPHLKLPYVFQWNTALEQMLGEKQSVSFTFVGSHGRRLLTQQTYYPGNLGNLNFTNAGILGYSTPLTVTAGRATSDYNALQVQFERRINQGLQFHASYTWSHSIDETSTNYTIDELLRGDSDFDIRNNFQLALTYNIPGTYHNRFASALLRDRSADVREFARSSAPVNVTSTTGLDPALGLELVYQADIVPGQPFYLYGDQYPGRRRINPAAFTTASAGQNGDLGRNALRGFDAVDTDLAVHREFRLTEALHLQARIESFNLFNRPIMGAINNTLNSPNTFGLASSTLNNQLGGAGLMNPLYQVGGPRSTQISLKFQF
jgi:hypothetical protein